MLLARLGLSIAYTYRRGRRQDSSRCGLRSREGPPGVHQLCAFDKPSRRLHPRLRRPPGPATRRRPCQARGSPQSSRLFGHKTQRMTGFRIQSNRISSLERKKRTQPEPMPAASQEFESDGTWESWSTRRFFIKKHCCPDETGSASHQYCRRQPMEYLGVTGNELGSGLLSTRELKTHEHQVGSGAFLMHDLRDRPSFAEQHKT